MTPAPNIRPPRPLLPRQWFADVPCPYCPPQRDPYTGATRHVARRFTVQAYTLAGACKQAGALCHCRDRHDSRQHVEARGLTTPCGGVL